MPPVRTESGLLFAKYDMQALPGLEFGVSHCSIGAIAPLQVVKPKKSRWSQCFDRLILRKNNCAVVRVKQGVSVISVWS